MSQKGNPHLCVPLFSTLCIENSPLVALSNDKVFRPLRRTTKAARLGGRPLFEKRGAKTFNNSCDEAEKNK